MKKIIALALCLIFLQGCWATVAAVLSGINLVHDTYMMSKEVKENVKEIKERRKKNEKS